MNGMLVATLVATAGALPWPDNEAPATIDLGGVRRATAVVERSGPDWLVAVRMLPVQAFDEATNAALSREKARLCALQALAKHLSDKIPAELSVSGVTVVGVVLDGTTCQLRLRIPSRGVRVVWADTSTASRRNDAGKPQPERVAFLSILLTRKSDYSDTLTRLASLLTGKIDRLEPGHERFELSVAELEEETLDGMRRLAGAIRGDRLLLTLEKEELLAAVQRRGEAVMAQLKKKLSSKPVGGGTDCGLLTEGAEKFSEVRIDKEFEGYLLGSPLLMEVAGAKVIKLDGGRHVVLAVASTALKDRSAGDRLRAERVCRVKALAAVVAEKKGVQVGHTERLEDRTVVVLDGKKESAKSVTQLLSVTTTRVEGLAKDMPVVGRWKSSDGNVFYLAMGLVVGKDGHPVVGNKE